MYTNLNNPVNYQLQDFGQFGFRVLDSTSMVVDGETYRTLYVVDDAVVSATTSKGDDLVSKPLLSGTLLHGLFSAPTVASGKVLAYMAGRLTAEEILELYTAYLTAIAGTTLENTDCLYDDLNQMGADTYADASLVLIPSGYSTGVVYGQRPLDSNSQITFTRASNATRVINGGLIEKVRTNLALQSQTLSVSPTWTAYSGTTITADAVAAPDGTLTADQISGTSGAFRGIRQTITSSAVPHTFSVYLRSATGSSTTARIWVDSGVSTVTVTTSWQRFSVTATTASSFDIQISTAISSAIDVYAWGAQLETGDIATDYIATGASAVSVGPVSNVPRIDYTGGGCGKLLLEPQRTNLALFSEQFDNAAWSKTSLTVTANAGISPDGYQNADLLTPTATDSYLRRLTLSFTSGTTYTASIYLKSNTGSSFENIIRLRENSGAQDLIKSITVTAEWSRFDITLTANTTSTYTLWIGGTSTWSTGENLFAWGAQVEAGAYATSYIPTLASSVTRVADAASKTGITNLIGQTEGTLFAVINSQQAGSTYNWINLTDGTVNNWVFIGKDVTKWRGYVKASGTLIFDNSATTISDNTDTKIALAYKSGEIALYINGTQIATNSSAFSFTAALSQFIIGTIGAAVGERSLNSQTLVFKKRLSNDELAALTTL